MTSDWTSKFCTVYYAIYGLKPDIINKVAIDWSIIGDKANIWSKILHFRRVKVEKDIIGITIFKILYGKYLHVIQL